MPALDFSPLDFGPDFAILPRWPDTINSNVELGSFSEQPEDAVAKFVPEVGPEIRRRRTGLVSDMISFTTLFTVDERTAFWAFYRNDIASGVLAFFMKHPATRVPTRFQFAEVPKVSALVQVGLATVAGAARRRYRASLKLRSLPY